MDIKKIFIVLCVSFFQSYAADNQALTVYAIPGQNGLGSEKGYVKRLLDLGYDDTVVSVGTPSWFPDFGQRNCLRYAQNAIQDDGIIHATSQGTATALNYVAHYDTNRKIKALILEAVMLSGNNAIHHTVGGPLMQMPGITALSGSYYWLPYLAKMQFPLYWPSGKQPIKSLKNIPTAMPIVISHFKTDPQLSYNDACALYYGLKAYGNDNVYFISKPGSGHCNVLCEDRDQDILRAIFEKHNLISPNKRTSVAVDLSEYQPDHHQYKNLYDNLLAKERNHEAIMYPAGLIGAAGLVAGMWKLTIK